ncbi:MAG: Swt1 family HEPN domain-containing protein [bacterium]|nr:Swt1 family HEPN domain-containing protein [bacterium]
MQELLKIATDELARFLSKYLPTLSADWWKTSVVDRLTFQQQRFVSDHNHDSLEKLDLSALLRVLDQNWHDLDHLLNFPREGRSWVKELQSVRNKWAHQSTEEVPQHDTYRDADTLSRLFSLIEASPKAQEVVDSVKSAALTAMANVRVKPTLLSKPVATDKDPVTTRRAVQESTHCLPEDLNEIDAAVRKRDLRPRALQEETGLTGETPVRGRRESDSYWNTRVLTHRVLGMHYRTPQLNLYLLEDHINSRTFGRNRVTYCVYVAPGDRNLNFDTSSGRVTFDAHQEIDPALFLGKFGLNVSPKA